MPELRNFGPGQQQTHDVKDTIMPELWKPRQGSSRPSHPASWSEGKSLQSADSLLYH